jgi:hypothetical protein
VAVGKFPRCQRGAGREPADPHGVTIEAVAIFAELEFGVVEHVRWCDHARLRESFGDIPPV